MSDPQEVKGKKGAGKKAAGGENGATEPGEKKDRARSSKNFNGELKISLLSDKNPKREGSKAHGRFALYKDGQTVAEFVKAGGTFGDLAWDSSRGFIAIEGYTPKMVVKKEKAKKEAGSGAEKAAA